MNQTTLISQACQGDELAWTQLVRDHQQAVFRLAWLLVADADVAEDVAQETFIRAFRALPQFDAQRPMRPWLLRITTNVAHNRRRAMHRYVAAVRRWFQAEPTQTKADVALAADKALEADLLWQAVQTLARKDREIIYLRYFLELSVAETSQILKIAIGTVKSRTARALDKLQRVIERDFPALQEERLGK